MTRKRAWELGTAAAMLLVLGAAVGGYLLREARQRRLNGKLIEAMERRDVRAVYRLVNAGADVRARTREGHTVLILAAQWGEVSLVRFALKRHPEVDVADGSGMTPLSHAAWKGRGAVVKLLLDAGANIEVRDTYLRQTPLMWAAQMKSPRHTDAVNALLTRGADTEARDFEGKTALILAVKRGRLATVQALLSHQADTQARDGNGRNAAQVAAVTGNRAAARLLTAAGSPR